MTPKAEHISLELKNIELKESFVNEFSYSSALESPAPKSILEVSSPITSSHIDALDTSTSYVLPFRHNRGKLPSRYYPYVERKKKNPSIRLLILYLLNDYLNLSRHLHINYLSAIFPITLKMLYQIQDVLKP